MANTVTLTLAGDSKQLEDAFSRVGAASKKMTDEVGQAASGFDRAGEAADSIDTKAMGFRDTLTGLQDGFAGLKAVSKDGFNFESLLLLGFGIGDLASGFYNLLIPSMKSAITWMGNTRIGMAITAGATKVWTGAQWLLNTAFLASPITWIVLGIIALVAVIVLIATKTTWFQDAWKVAWGWIKKTAIDVWEWLKALPEKIGSTFKAIADFITWPFRTAFNAISDMWNKTVGSLHWDVPSWIPIVGGNSISAPKLPRFHAGGTVPGAPGTEMMAILQAGERVSPAGSGGNVVLEVRSGGTRFDDLLVEALSRAIGVRGGNVQLVLGSGTRG